MGMAYGVISSTLLLGLGMTPALALASVHLAELASTGVSGLSHGYFGKSDRRLFLRLAWPGVLGGMIGAFLLRQFQAPWLRPLVALYLPVLGTSGVVTVLGATSLNLSLRGKPLR